MRLVAALALLVACRSSETGGGSRQITVSAFAGDVAEPGVRIVAHSPDGEVIDQTNADGVGQAAIGVDDDSLVSVVFPGNLGTQTSLITVVTVPAPETELAIHGPRHDPPPLIVGVLQVSGPRLNAAAYFDIQFGCATARVTTLPTSLDVGACNLGTDNKLDVLVGGYHDVGGDPPAPQLDGYSAGRVQMANGLATLAIPSWQTTGTTVPVTADGVTPVVDVEWLSDGLSFGGQTVTDHATLYTGLVVDATRITAALPGINAARVTTRELAGPPTAIALSGDDFLPALSRTTTLAMPATFSWDAAGLGDAVNLHATWEVDSRVARPASTSAPAVPIGPHRVVWDAVLPPDATGVTLPDFGDLAGAIAPLAIVPDDVLLRYVDSDHHDGFAALVADGVHAEETLQPSSIAARNGDGQIRVSHAIGLR